jgi:acyl-CoA thioester hydrolase
MARLKLIMPENYLFSTEIDVRISDINYGGHLANDAVLSIIHEARLRFLSANGYSEKNIEGAGLIMADASIVYKSEAFYGDHLKIEVALGDISRLGFDIYYRLKNTKTDKDVAHVKTSMAFFSYDLHKIISAPEKFIRKFSNQAM